MVDGQGNPNIEGGGLTLILPHEGTDPEEIDQWPELTVSIADPDREWIADEKRTEEFDIEPGVSQVDSYTVDGSRASGAPPGVRLPRPPPGAPTRFRRGR